MRIATWNLARVRPTGRRANALLKHIETASADVWVLTETHLRFSPGAGYRMVTCSTPARDRTADERWTAIWVRDTIHAAPVVTDDAERTACARLTNGDGPTLLVYGTVLPWLSDRRRLPLSGAAAFMAALAEQSADWRQIRSVHPGAGLCVAGDLNQDLRPTGHYYGSAARRAGLRTVFAELGLTCLTGEARDPVARLGAGRASIDHVCIAGIPLPAPEDAVISVWPAPEHVGRRLSDHHGVAVDIGGTSTAAQVRSNGSLASAWEAA